MHDACWFVCEVHSIRHIDNSPPRRFVLDSEGIDVDLWFSPPQSPYSISPPVCGALSLKEGCGVVILLAFLAQVVFSSCLRPFQMVNRVYRFALLIVDHASGGVLQISLDIVQREVCVRNLRIH